MEKIDLNIDVNQEPTKGSLLLAEPLMPDSHFQRAVVLLCEHNDDGSLGIIINRPMEMSLEDIAQDLCIEGQLFLGGPVDQDNLFFIHTFDEIENSLPIKNGLYLGGNFNSIKALAMSGKINSSNCKFFSGYSGWGKFQLKQEIQKGSWVVADSSINDIFSISNGSLWTDTLKNLGGKYKILANYPTDPKLN